MYDSMSRSSQNLIIDRGMALHKMIRFITMTLGGHGYLNFMGNEFGHPEWIDFPREGNQWSYQYCRRQWSLVDNPNLKYSWLNEFDRAMIAFSKQFGVIDDPKAYNMWTHQHDEVLVYEKAGMTFAFNFNPIRSFNGYFVPVGNPGRYQAVFSTDEGRFGGQDRVAKDVIYNTVELPDGRFGFLVYLPSRTASVFRKLEEPTAEVAATAVEKPKRKYTRRKKAEPEVIVEKPVEAAAEEVSAEKPKRKYTRRKKVEPEVTAEKPVEAAAEEVPTEKPKRKYTRRKKVETAESAE